ncbi:MAG: hypothetical protein U0Y82_07595 [Thermoleophilia bacterium]
MRFRTHLPLLGLACAVALAGCGGPTGPEDQGGSQADPVALLHILPTPPGLVDDGGDARAATPGEALDAMLGAATVTPTMTTRAADAGMVRAAVRGWHTRTGGTMVASVSVWPAKTIAANFGLQLTQQRLGHSGVSAWTPTQVPGSQGVRSTGADHERILSADVGPNVIVVRATGDVTDDTVAVAMARLVRVQEARG